jgi:hypothetical protein
LEIVWPRSPLVDRSGLRPLRSARPVFAHPHAEEVLDVLGFGIPLTDLAKFGPCRAQLPLKRRLRSAAAGEFFGETVVFGLHCLQRLPQPSVLELGRLAASARQRFLRGHVRLVAHRRTPLCG